ncbi:MAG TPA: DinB family protein [Sporosarcina sp.]|nr:DinB family protein [Sporosarcina sp.]
MARMHTISRVKRVADDKWHPEPDGFNNNILWHAGHIFVIHETFLQKGIPSYEVRHPEWVKYFDDGTSPSEWDQNVPSGETVLAELRAQLDWIIPFIENKLEADMVDPVVIGNDVMIIDTMEGLIQFLSWHEGTHAGVIFAMNTVDA